MSSPTEQTQVMASSLSRHSAPDRAAVIMPSSSLTGMNAPDSLGQGGESTPMGILRRA